MLGKTLKKDTLLPTILSERIFQLLGIGFPNLERKLLAVFVRVPKLLPLLFPGQQDLFFSHSKPVGKILARNILLSITILKKRFLKDRKD